MYDKEIHLENGFVMTDSILFVAKSIRHGQHESIDRYKGAPSVDEETLKPTTYIQ
jgi:hypothetical protein